MTKLLALDLNDVIMMNVGGLAITIGTICLNAFFHNGNDAKGGTVKSPLVWIGLILMLAGWVIVIISVAGKEDAEISATVFATLSAVLHLAFVAASWAKPDWYSVVGSKGVIAVFSVAFIILLATGISIAVGKVNSNKDVKISFAIIGVLFIAWALSLGIPSEQGRRCTNAVTDDTWWKRVSTTDTYGAVGVTTMFGWSLLSIANALA